MLFLSLYFSAHFTKESYFYESMMQLFLQIFNHLYSYSIYVSISYEKNYFNTDCANENEPLFAAGEIFKILQNMLYRLTFSTTSSSTALLLILGPFICNTACMSSPIVGSNLRRVIASWS